MNLHTAGGVEVAVAARKESETNLGGGDRAGIRVGCVGVAGTPVWLE